MPQAISIPVTANATQLYDEILRQARRAEAAVKKIPLRIETKDLGGFKTLTADIDRFDKSVSRMSAVITTFGQAAAIIFGIQNAFAAMVKTSITVEKQLNDINAIFGASSNTMKQFSDGLFDVAKQTGQSFDTAALAAQEFARQGLGVEQTLKRTRDALTLTRISGLDAANATESLTAILNTFNKEALDSTRITNILANVDTKFAVSAADLTEALKRAGASASDAKVPFNELVAAVTSLQQSTARGGSVIGNSLKSIFTRLQRGSTVDALREIGVEVRDAEGNLRPMLQTLQDLSSKFYGLSDATQASIKEQVAGVYQINQLSALLADLSSGYSTYERALRVANGTQNEATERLKALKDVTAGSLNDALANLTKFAAESGKVVINPIVKGSSDFLNNFFSTNEGADQGKTIGQEIGQGLLEGLGSYLSTGGAVIIGKALFNISRLVAVGVKDQIIAATTLGRTSEKQLFLQEQVKSVMLSTDPIVQNILRNTTSEADKRLQILGILQKQEASLLHINALSAKFASDTLKSGFTGFNNPPAPRRFFRGRTAAGGYLPSMIAEKQAVNKGVGGAPRSARPVAIPNFNLGGGKKETIIANSSEYIVPNYANGGSAIFNQDMIKSMGLPKGAKKIMAGGYIPNFFGEYSGRAKHLNDFYSRAFPGAKMPKVFIKDFNKDAEFNKFYPGADANEYGGYFYKDKIKLNKNQSDLDLFRSLVHETGHAAESNLSQYQKNNLNRALERDIEKRGKSVGESFLGSHAKSYNDAEFSESLAESALMSFRTGKPGAKKGKDSLMYRYIRRFINKRFAGGYIPNFEKGELMGSGLFGSFYKLRGNVGVKRFNTRLANVSGDTIEERIEKAIQNKNNAIKDEFLVGKMLSSENLIPGVTAPKIIGSLKNSLQKGRIGKEVITDPLGQKVLDSPDFVGNVLTAMFDSLGIQADDLHGQNYTVNKSGSDLLNSNVGYKLAMRAMRSGSGRTDKLFRLANKFSKRGGKINIIDAGLVGTPTGALDHYSKAGGYIPNFAKVRFGKSPNDIGKEGIRRLSIGENDSYLDYRTSKIDGERALAIEFLKSRKRGEGFEMFNKLVKLGKKAKINQIYSTELLPQGSREELKNLVSTNSAASALFKAFPQLSYRNQKGLGVSGSITGLGESLKFRGLKDLNRIASSSKNEGPIKYAIANKTLGLFNLKTKIKAGGYIPNFNPLLASAQREAASLSELGYSKEQIFKSLKVQSSPRLKNKGNPNGLGLFNTLQGQNTIGQALADHRGENLQKSGIPNFADNPDFDQFKKFLRQDIKKNNASRNPFPPGQTLKDLVPNANFNNAAVPLVARIKQEIKALDGLLKATNLEKEATEALSRKKRYLGKALDSVLNEAKKDIKLASQSVVQQALLERNQSNKQLKNKGFYQTQNSRGETIEYDEAAQVRATRKNKARKINRGRAEEISAIQTKEGNAALAARTDRILREREEAERQKKNEIAGQQRLNQRATEYQVDQAARRNKARDLLEKRALSKIDRGVFTEDFVVSRGYLSDKTVKKRTAAKKADDALSKQEAEEKKTIEKDRTRARRQDRLQSVLLASSLASPFIGEFAGRAFGDNEKSRGNRIATGIANSASTAAALSTLGPAGMVAGGAVLGYGGLSSVVKSSPEFAGQENTTIDIEREIDKSNKLQAARGSFQESFLKFTDATGFGKVRAEDDLKKSISAIDDDILKRALTKLSLDSSISKEQKIAGQIDLFGQADAELQVSGNIAASREFFAQIVDGTSLMSRLNNQLDFAPSKLNEFTDLLVNTVSDKELKGATVNDDFIKQIIGRTGLDLEKFKGNPAIDAAAGAVSLELRRRQSQNKFFDESKEIEKQKAFARTETVGTGKALFDRASLASSLNRKSLFDQIGTRLQSPVFSDESRAEINFGVKQQEIASSFQDGLEGIQREFINLSKTDEGSKIADLLKDLTGANINGDISGSIDLIKNFKGFNDTEGNEAQKELVKKINELVQINAAELDNSNKIREIQQRNEQDKKLLEYFSKSGLKGAENLGRKTTVGSISTLSAEQELKNLEKLPSDSLNKKERIEAARVKVSQARIDEFKARQERGQGPQNNEARLRAKSSLLFDVQNVTESNLKSDLLGSLSSAGAGPIGSKLTTPIENLRKIISTGSVEDADRGIAAFEKQSKTSLSNYGIAGPESSAFLEKILSDFREFQDQRKNSFSIAETKASEIVGISDTKASASDAKSIEEKLADVTGPSLTLLNSSVTTYERTNAALITSLGNYAKETKALAKVIAAADAAKFKLEQDKFNSDKKLEAEGLIADFDLQLKSFVDNTKVTFEENARAFLKNPADVTTGIKNDRIGQINYRVDSGNNETLSKTAPKLEEVLQKLIDKLAKLGISFADFQKMSSEQKIVTLSSNFDPYASAIRRAKNKEVRAGIPHGEIYTDTDKRLISPTNPMGLMVANYLDEPNGGYEGVDRKIKRGLNPKLSEGRIPNFAEEDLITKFQNENNLTNLDRLRLSDSVPSGSDNLRFGVELGLSRFQSGLNSMMSYIPFDTTKEYFEHRKSGFNKRSEIISKFLDRGYNLDAEEQAKAIEDFKSLQNRNGEKMPSSIREAFARFFEAKAAYRKTKPVFNPQTVATVAEEVPSMINPINAATKFAKAGNVLYHGIRGYLMSDGDKSKGVVSAGSHVVGEIIESKLGGVAGNLLGTAIENTTNNALSGDESKKKDFLKYLSERRSKIEVPNFAEPRFKVKPGYEPKPYGRVADSRFGGYNPPEKSKERILSPSEIAEIERSKKPRPKHPSELGPSDKPAVGDIRYDYLYRDKNIIPKSPSELGPSDKPAVGDTQYDYLYNKKPTAISSPTIPIAKGVSVNDGVGPALDKMAYKKEQEAIFKNLKDRKDNARIDRNNKNRLDLGRNDVGYEQHNESMWKFNPETSTRVNRREGREVHHNRLAVLAQKYPVAERNTGDGWISDVYALNPFLQQVPRNKGDTNDYYEKDKGIQIAKEMEKSQLAAEEFLLPNRRRNGRSAIKPITDVSPTVDPIIENFRRKKADPSALTVEQENKKKESDAIKIQFKSDRAELKARLEASYNKYNPSGDYSVDSKDPNSKAGENLDSYNSKLEALNLKYTKIDIRKAPEMSTLDKISAAAYEATQRDANSKPLTYPDKINDAAIKARARQTDAIQKSEAPTSIPPSTTTSQTTTSTSSGGVDMASLDKKISEINTLFDKVTNLTASISSNMSLSINGSVSKTMQDMRSIQDEILNKVKTWYDQEQRLKGGKQSVVDIANVALT